MIGNGCPPHLGPLPSSNNPQVKSLLLHQNVQTSKSRCVFACTVCIAHYNPIMYNSLWDKSRSVQNVLHGFFWKGAFLTLDLTLQVAHMEKWVDNPANIYMRNPHCGYSRMRIYPHHSTFQASAWPSLFLTLEKPRWFIWRSESIILPPLFYLLAAEKEQLRTFGRWCTAKFCRNNSVHPLVV